MNTFLWLLRRELWECRSIWVVPAVCAAIMIGGGLLASALYGSATIDFDRGMSHHELAGPLTPATADAKASEMLGGIAIIFLVVALITQMFYTLDAIYGERRDRSILFWKSLPVSDTETVLAKLSVAALLIPLVAFAFAFVTQLALFTMLGAKLPATASLAGHLWSPATWAGSALVMLYVIVASVLWYLPFLAWLLLISAWAPRAPFMWAALPPFALGLAEFVVFRSSHLLHVVGERVGNMGFLSHAFTNVRGAGFTFGYSDQALGTTSAPVALVDRMQPALLFSSATLWAGVVVGAALVAATIWMRRYRDAST